MYGHGDEEQRLTAISTNHLDVRDTVSAEWLHYQTNTHAYTHICVCPSGPCGEVECISLLCPGRRGMLEGRWRVMWVRGGREVAVVREYARRGTRNLSGAAAMMEVINLRALLASHTHTHTHIKAQICAHMHACTQTSSRRDFSTTSSKHASAFKGCSHTHTQMLTYKNKHSTQTK